MRISRRLLSTGEHQDTQPTRGEVTQVAPRRVSLWAHEPRVKVVVSRHVTRYGGRVILSFRHKGLEKLYRDGTKKGVQADHVPKLLRILSALDVAQGPDDLAIPSFRTHRLKGDLAGHYSIWVNGNWRITFRFIESDAELVDYQDYH
jgi:toxin HigB-1